MNTTSPLTDTEIVRQAREIVEEWELASRDDPILAMNSIAALLSRADEAERQPSEKNPYTDHLAQFWQDGFDGKEIDATMRGNALVAWSNGRRLAAAQAPAVPTDAMRVVIEEIGKWHGGKDDHFVLTAISDALSATPPEAPAALSAPPPVPQSEPVLEVVALGGNETHLKWLGSRDFAPGTKFYAATPAPQSEASTDWGDHFDKQRPNFAEWFSPSTEGLSAGVRIAALEEAAKECDRLVYALDNAGEPYYRPAAADRCAAAIRALAATPTLEPVQEGVGEVLHRMKYHEERAENGDVIDWDLYPIDTDECKECFEVWVVRPRALAAVQGTK